MKHLLSGVAIAAMLSVAAAAWAETPMTPATPQPAAAAPSHPATAAHKAIPQRRIRRQRYAMSGSDHVANQLNAAELGRLNAGPYPPPTPGYMPAYPSPAYAPPYAAPWGYPPPPPYPSPWGYPPPPWGYR